MDLRRQIAIVRAWLPLLLAVTVAAAMAGFVFSGLQHKTYEARATLIVGQSLSAANPDYNQLLVSQRLSSTYASVATTRPNLDAVAKTLNLNMSGDDLSRLVHADAALDSTLLTITVQDTDPDRAAAIANAVADQLIATSPAVQGRQTDLQKSIDAELQATQNQIQATRSQMDALTALPSRTSQQDIDLQTLNGQLITLRSTYATLLSFSSANSSNLLSVIEPAVVSTTPVAPRTLLNVLLASLLALLAVTAVLATAERLDDRLKTAEGVESSTGLAGLGSVPSIKGDRGRPGKPVLPARTQPRSAAADDYRSIRTNIGFATSGRPIRTLLISSADRGEGRTVVASNLAIAFAELGRRVLLVDADLRNPSVHLVFELANSHGLTTLLRSGDVDPVSVVQEGGQENLRILTTGPLPPNPVELLGSDRMRDLVKSLVEASDLVIFDGPPVRPVADAAILSSLVDATVIVIEANHTHQPAVRQVVETLGRAGAHVVGAVLNRISVGSHAGNDYFGYEEFAPAAGAVGAPTERSGGADISPTPSEQ